MSDDEVIINLGGEPRHPASGSHKAIPGQNRRYRIRGLNKNLSIHHLKVNVLVSKGEALHVDTFDLYAAKSRGLFIKQVVLELDMKDTVIKKDLGQILLKLEALQETQINQTLKNRLFSKFSTFFIGSIFERIVLVHHLSINCPAQ